MKRAVVLSVLVAATAGLAALSRRPPRSPVFRAPAAARSAGGSPRPSLCPPGTLPDQGVCIPVPRSPDLGRLGASEALVPRRPDRPADYAEYVLPVAASGSPKVVASDPTANRDAGVIRTGISISATAATQVVASVLDGQDGPARIVFVGALVGKSAVTRHTVRTGDRTNDYLVILGNLEATGALTPNMVVTAGAVLGTVGASPVYLETRLLRPGVDPLVVPAERMLDDSVAISVDPRNVLQLRH